MGLFDLFRRKKPKPNIPDGAIDQYTHIRPYVPLNKSVPFVADRAPGEIEAALETIQRGGAFSWGGYHQTPGELTPDMIADAENAIRVKLPASYLAILRMQNGGYPYKNTFRTEAIPGLSESIPVLRFLGIAPGHGSECPIQELPKITWEHIEGYLDDTYYDQWRDTLDDVHPDWGDKVRIPETIVLVAPEAHWGIALNYIRCGRQGEPSVVHLEMEDPSPEEVLTEIAPDFMTFLKGCTRQ